MSFPTKYNRKTFNQKMHVLHTPKYKIYLVSQDVYTYDNKYVCHLDSDELAIARSLMKYPTEFYKKRVDNYIDKQKRI